MTSSNAAARRERFSFAGEEVEKRLAISAAVGRRQSVRRNNSSITSRSVSLRRGEGRDAPGRVGQLRLKEVAALEHQGHVQRGVGVPLALARARPRRPAEHPQERVRELAVGQLHRPRAGREPLELLRDAGHVAHRVEQRLRPDAAAARSARSTSRRRRWSRFFRRTTGRPASS